MSSSKDYLEYVVDLLSDLDDITWRAMMGEYVLYYRGRVFGGVYDDRFLVKPLDVVRSMFPHAIEQIPYEGAKPMVVVDSEDKRLIAEVVEAMYPHLPEPKKRTKKQ